MYQWVVYIVIIMALPVAIVIPWAVRLCQDLPIDYTISLYTQVCYCLTV